MDKMKMESVDMTEKNIEKIGELFPSCITEAKDENGNLKKAINFEMLKQLLSKDVIDGDEAYEFTWVGKKASIVEANKPIRKTLRPCKEESVNWDDRENLYIEGDNLEVLKLLQESYLGRVKMIYIDPPYNTGNDFIYNDDFKVQSEEWSVESGAVDEEGNRLFRNTDSNGRFHSDWCSMIYSRLMLARNLLSDDGAIFISISDNEISSLLKICNEIFGEENQIAIIAIEISKTQGMKVAAAQRGQMVKNHEYIVSYAKNIFTTCKHNPLYEMTEPWDSHFNYVIEKKNDEFECTILSNYIYENRKDIFSEFEKLGYTKNGRIENKNIGKAILYSDKIKKFFYEEISNIVFQEMACSVNVPEDIVNRLNNGEIVEYDKYLLTISSGGKIRQYRNLKENLHMSDEYKPEYCRTTIRGALWKGFYSDMMNVSKEGDIPFKNGKKPIRLMKQLAKWMNCDSDDIIIDFFGGSSSTAHAIIQYNIENNTNCKYIIVQIPELIEKKDELYKEGFRNICEIGKERIRRAGKKILEESGDNSTLNTQNSTLDVGFRVLKLADSNMTDVFYSPSEYSQNLLEQFESNIKADRNDLDLLFGCLLDWGLPLSLPYKSVNIDGYTIHNYNDGDLVACFDENIPDEVIKEIAKMQPLRAVFRDSSFANSPSKINVGEIFKLLAPDTRVKVI